MRFVHFAAMAAVLSAAAQAQSTSPLQQFVGQWRGSGTLRFSNEAVENVTCRAQNVLRGSELSVSVNCVNASFKMIADATLRIVGPVLVGNWRVVDPALHGALHGSIAPSGAINTTLAGSIDGFLSIGITGNRLLVHFTAPTAAGIRVTMTK